MAGDLSDFADRSIVRLVRLTERGTIVKKFDLRTEKIIDSEYYYIQPNDVLYIQPSGIKNVGIKHVSTMLSMAISTASIDRVEPGEREDLKTPAVRQDRAVPAHEAVQPPRLGEDG